MRCRSRPPTCGTIRSTPLGAPTARRGEVPRCAPSSKGAPRIRPCYVTPTRPGSSSCRLLRQHPLDERLAVGLARRGLRVLLARAQLGHHLALGVGLALVLRRDVLEGGTRLLLGHVMAAHAAALLG